MKNIRKVTKGKTRKVKINYFKFIRSLIVLGIIIYSLITISLNIVSNIKSKEYTGDYTTYYVSKGETLWTIAKEQNSDMDIREIVHLIRMDNDITPELSIGQELVLREIYE